MTRDVLAERADIMRAIEGQTLCSAFARTVDRMGDAEALRGRNTDGTWSVYTWNDYRERVRALALGLSSFGFSHANFALILCRNRPEHLMADTAVLHAAGTPVSVYNTLAPEQIAYIANNCRATVAFAENGEFLEKLAKIRDETGIQRVVLIEPSDAASSDWVITWDELLEIGRARHDRDPSLFEHTWRQVLPDDIATLVYTSGTTGPPKGVIDLHSGVLSNVEALSRVVPVGPGDRLLSYLPTAHAADRFLSHWQHLVNGPTTWLLPDITQLLPALLECRPTFWGAVPRVWEKLYAGINAILGAEPDADRTSMIMGAIEVGREFVAHEQKGVEPSADLTAKREAVEPVLAAIRSKVGLDQAKAVVTGAAPTPPEVLEFFHALGLRLNEVWGMSEITALGTINPPQRIRLGSIGVAIPGTELRIADDGELLIRGPQVMPGYFRDPERTEEALDDDGWLHTGDIATADADGYHTIVDRKKELIITAGGKNISPANLEGLLKRHPLVGQACVIGDNRPYLVALIVLDGEVAPVWARARGIEFADLAALSVSQEVVAEIGRAIEETNQHVSRVEQIKRHTILPVEWTAESEELTPTLKLKRRVIHASYADEIDAMYA